MSSYGDIVHSVIDTGQNKIIAIHTFTEGRIQNTIDVFKDPKLMFLKYRMAPMVYFEAGINSNFEEVD